MASNSPSGPQEFGYPDPHGGVPAGEQSTAHQAPFDYAAVSAQVAEYWPRLFGSERFVPLGIRVDKTLMADARARQLPISWHKLKQFLSGHCKDRRYVECVAQGGHRYGIVGEPLAEGVKAEHAAEARRRLAKGINAKKAATKLPPQP